jgi:hypothetical protein
MHQLRVRIMTAAAFTGAKLVLARYSGPVLGSPTHERVFRGLLYRRAHRRGDGGPLISRSIIESHGGRMCESAS